MAEQDPNENQQNYVVKSHKRLRRSKPTKGSTQIIRRTDVKSSSKKVRVVGGDTDEFEKDPPAIVLEKEGGRIKKIVVSCPCGRHSELEC